ncbi:MAG: substrate-binding domain-containing protein [Thermodesulfobacteriota bacterium]
MIKSMLSTRDVARLLGVNEKMVYTLVAEKGLPASKVTGKWLFPQHLVEQWVENHTLNFPAPAKDAPSSESLLILAGSNDLLLDRTISLFHNRFPDHLIAFANVGSMGGLRALRRNLCHVASSHLLQENGSEYNFDFARQALGSVPVVVNFCRREQGVLMEKDNPRNLYTVRDLGNPGIRIVNRSLQTGTRLLFDRELKKAGIAGEKIEGYGREVNRHLDVGLEIVSGRAHAGPAIRPVASLLDLGFIPLRWERYDLLMTRERFFDPAVQAFLSLLHAPAFREMANEFQGYDLSLAGNMIFPPEEALKAQHA